MDVFGIDILPYIPILIAVGTAVAAVAAWRAASASRNAARGNLVAPLLDEYASEDMAAHLRNIRQRADSVATILHALEELDTADADANWEELLRNAKQYQENFKPFDESRRRIQQYYKKIWTLQNIGLIDRDTAAYLLSSRGAEYLSQFIRPASLAQFFADVCGGDSGKFVAERLESHRWIEEVEQMRSASQQSHSSGRRGAGTVGRAIGFLQYWAPAIHVGLLVIAVITLVVAVRTLDTANTQREEAQELGAWGIIAMSPQARGNIGQKAAVEFLLRNGKDLRHVNLRQAHLIEVRLSGANLWNARLEGADLHDAKLRGAVLNIARLRGALLVDADLTGASLRCAVLSPGYAEDGSGLPFPNGADLRNATLVGVKFDGADLRHVNFDGADISGASFGQFDCDESDRRSAILTPEQLARACADPSNPPQLPARPEFDSLQLGDCPPK